MKTRERAKANARGKTRTSSRVRHDGAGSSFDDYLKKQGNYDKVMARAQAEVDEAKRAYDSSRWVRIKYTLAQWRSAVFNLVYLIPSPRKSKRTH